MSEITVTRALGELKLLHKKIQQGLNQQYISVSVGGATISGYKNLEEYNKASKKALQSIQDLITRRQAIKNAIVLSNASTKVIVGGNGMSVAEAIEMKQQTVEHRKALLHYLVRGLESAESAVERHNSAQESSLQRILEVQFGKSDQEKKAKETVIQQTSDSFWKVNGAELADPNGLRVIIETMTKEIDEFEAEVDYVLSESNTLTKITVA